MTGRHNQRFSGRSGSAGEAADGRGAMSVDLFRFHNHPAAPTAASPSTPRFTQRPGLEVGRSASSNCR